MTNNSVKIKTRFAPSPTGPAHIGSIRTALFNYLLSRKLGGFFVLRIEDTDKERSKIEWEHMLLKSMTWLGFDWDEGPIMIEGQESMFDNNSYDIKYIGENGPYRQSERTEIYKKYLQKMLDEGHAYYCFCTKEEVEAQKGYLMSIGESPVYKGTCRNITKEDAEERIKQGKKCVIRFKSPEKHKIVFEDLIKGKIEFDSETLGDFVIAKNLETPLYNFTCVVDDYEMGITHVIRGEDHVSNTPKQIIMFNALGVKPPIFAHIPLILGQGKKKLSKRDAETSLEEYYHEGYLPEAIINFVAFLGWNPGTEKEIYSMKELIEDFSVEKIQKSGAIFNSEKLDWINGLYIRKKSIDQLTKLCIPFLIEANLIKRHAAGTYLTVDTEELIPTYKIEKSVALYQERMKKLLEIAEFTDFVFKKDIDYDKSLLKWKAMTEEETIVSLEKSLELIRSIINFDKENIEKVIFSEAEKMPNRGDLLWPFRVALTGKQSSAGPTEIAELLGKEKCLDRIELAIKKIKYA
ncbi:MAG: glutamate--tRNA ligase [Candidatus Paceibacterota bacterium]|jgi:nondiscriminating glutamyl-tRNA synthetase|nr:glutamate--tRNA ligase [bacterium]